MGNSIVMRYERKYRIEDYSAAVVHQVLMQNPAFFRTAYPDRYVNSLYLDTWDLASLSDNLAGVARRTKYRIRWYGALTKVEKAVLEKKEKSNMLGWKEFGEMPPFDWADREFSLSAYLAKALPEHVISLQPVLLVRYLRSYYEGLGGKLRATIDQKQEFFPILGKGRISSQGVRDAAVILEMKYAAEEESLVDQALQATPFRLSKNSKFANGLFAVYS